MSLDYTHSDFRTYIPEWLEQKCIREQDTDPTAKRVLQGIEDGYIVVIRPLPDPLRPASTITDLAFVQAVAKLRKMSGLGYGHYYWVMVPEMAEELDIHPNRIRSKMRRMMKRKLIDGCNCGCRGDIELLPAGELLLLKGE